MARAGTTILDSGDPLPSISLETVRNERVWVPEVFREGWGVFLLYRGHW
jgi:hypothetical protein